MDGATRDHWVIFDSLINHRIHNLMCVCYSPRSPVRGASWAHGTQHGEDYESLKKLCNFNNGPDGDH